LQDKRSKSKRQLKEKIHERRILLMSVFILQHNIYYFVQIHTYATYKTAHKNYTILALL